MQYLQWSFKLDAVHSINAALMTIEKWASPRVIVLKVKFFHSVMHTDNMMDEQTDGPTHFS